MEDKAAEARREKIRNLEFSLFGENNNNGVVGLPRVKAVDEYHERYSDVYKDKLKKEDPHLTRADLPLFYKEPKKKVKLSSPTEDLKSFLGSDESTQATPAPDIEHKFCVESDESGSTTWLQSRKQSARPKTVEALLSEELENLGIGDKKLSNTEHAQKLWGKKVAERKHSAFISDIHENEEGRSNLMQVGQFEEARGKAMFLSQEKNIIGKNKLFTNKISRSEKLLNMEQDELSMSLSTAKFKLLKNANLERVKAEDRLSEEDEGKLLEIRKKSLIGYTRNAKNKPSSTFEDMPEHIYDEMPSDTFKDIPEDVFDNIPRAVTARIRNREKIKAVKKDHVNLFETKQVDYTASAPAVPDDGNDNQEEVTGENEATSIGFIAMLFTGAPLTNGRQAGNLDQVESDFMFALFIQKQEDEANMDRNRPAPPARQQEEDSSVGHFCAPHLPGFCQANFCIFHTSGP